MGPGNNVLDVEVHIGAISWIWLNVPFAAVIRPYFDHLLSIWANVIAETDLLYIVL